MHGFVLTANSQWIPIPAVGVLPVTEALVTAGKRHQLFIWRGRMRQGFAAKIAELAHNEGLDVKVYEDYSGRGMYGDTTTGLVGATGDIMVGLALYAFDLGEASDEESDESIQNLVDDLRNLCQDNMGRSLIFY